ncbi:MAG TPA: rhodanese-like domain-containing protein [Casimicrobiaceae bacterium]
MPILEFVEKNWMLVATLVASGAMLLWPIVGRRLSGGRELGTLGATQLINTQNPLLLDLREAKEIEGGKLPNAVHVPLSQLPSRGGELAKYVARPVIVYCDRGQRGRTATALLAKLGFKDIYHLQGGFKAWKDAGLPVQK